MIPNWLRPKLSPDETSALRARVARAEVDTRKAVTQAVFWRVRAIELGAGADEWQAKTAEAATLLRTGNFDPRRVDTLGATPGEFIEGFVLTELVQLREEVKRLRQLG